ncbi:MAG TPA: hypothetical protein VF799_11720 [Geobacteraceae bacterium]
MNYDLDCSFVEEPAKKMAVEVFSAISAFILLYVLWSVLCVGGAVVQLTC